LHHYFVMIIRGKRERGRREGGKERGEGRSEE
jgi:hypothetical protein